MGLGLKERLVVAKAEEQEKQAAEKTTAEKEGGDRELSAELENLEASFAAMEKDISEADEVIQEIGATENLNDKMVELLADAKTVQDRAEVLKGDMARVKAELGGAEGAEAAGEVRAEPQEAVPANIQDTERTPDLPAISQKNKALIDKMINGYVDKFSNPENVDQDADPNHTLELMRNGSDRKAFAGALEHFTAAVDMKRKEKGLASLESYNFAQSVALSGVLFESHNLQSQGVEVNQKMIDNITVSFLRAANASLKEAEPDKISRMLTERSFLVNKIQKELNARLIAGETILPDLEKNYAEFLQILEKNDAEVKRYNKETEQVPPKERYKREVRGSFLTGGEFSRDSDGVGMYDVMQYRFKDKQSEKPKDRQAYVDRAYEVYDSIMKKYGLNALAKPESSKEQVRRFGKSAEVKKEEVGEKEEDEDTFTF